MGETIRAECTWSPLSLHKSWGHGKFYACHSVDTFYLLSSHADLKMLLRHKRAVGAKVPPLHPNYLGFMAVQLRSNTCGSGSSRHLGTPSPWPSNDHGWAPWLWRTAQVLLPAGDPQSSQATKMSLMDRSLALCTSGPVQSTSPAAVSSDSSSVGS